MVDKSLFCNEGILILAIGIPMLIFAYPIIKKLRTKKYRQTNEVYAAIFLTTFVTGVIFASRMIKASFINC
jgi:hypothetical protein